MSSPPPSKKQKECPKAPTRRQSHSQSMSGSMTPAPTQGTPAMVKPKAMRPPAGDPSKLQPPKDPPPSMAKGGMVKKTGLYKLHKGKKVIPVKDVKNIMIKKK